MRAPSDSSRSSACGPTEVKPALEVAPQPLVEARAQRHLQPRLVGREGHPRRAPAGRYSKRADSSVRPMRCEGRLGARGELFDHQRAPPHPQPRARPGASVSSQAARCAARACSFSSRLRLFSARWYCRGSPPGSREAVEHRAVEEGAPPVGPALHHREVVGREGHHRDAAEVVVERAGGLSVDEGRPHRAAVGGQGQLHRDLALGALQHEAAGHPRRPRPKRTSSEQPPGAQRLQGGRK